MPKLRRDGVDIYYEVHGEGPVILLSHGFASASGMWKGQIEPLSKTHRLVIWDMRGHGRSDYPEDRAAYTEEATVADIAALLDAVGAEKAIVGGLSLGGYMSLAFHHAHPERVAALMIFDTGPGYRNDEAREGWNQTAIRRAERFERDGPAALGAGAEVRVVSHRSTDGLAKAARGMLTQRNANVINSLPGIGVPTLVLAGSRDERYLAAFDYMAAKIPGAKKVMIEDAGHSANIDQPEAFNRAACAFLDSLGERV
ncbi:MAG TPA: alpha/beta fold hydrolase [Caulobacteraceae bacterium]|nr:alpha/beta fold hydrolase [Caulobacteraceae bacterium]